jgi:hypothetical protein
VFLVAEDSGGTSLVLSEELLHGDASEKRKKRMFKNRL